VVRSTIVDGLDRRASTPFAARNFLETMRGLFQWAHERGYVGEDPSAGVKPPKVKRGPGFKPWTEDDVDAYQRKWKIGTRQRVWLDVLLYTGLRRGDAVRIGHIRDNIATIRTEKSGETIEVKIPVLAILQKTLDAGPTGDLAWICGARGEPLTKESFGNDFAEAARGAGARKSAHGARKIAATTAANNGATVSELEAIFGWRGGGVAALYTKGADRARLARSAITKLDGNRRSGAGERRESSMKTTSICASGGRTRDRTLDLSRVKGTLSR